MTNPDAPFFKGLPVNRERHRERREDVEGSVYHWWWRFLRLSPILWFKWRYEAVLNGPVARVARDFDPLSHSDFYRWWLRVGSKLFAEEDRPPKVKTVSSEEIRRGASAGAIYVEVPLTIRRQTILKQFRSLLAQHHEGRGLPSSTPTAVSA